MGKTRDLLSRQEAVTPKGLPRVTVATAASASGETIVDVEGKSLIDFAGGIGVMNAGHCQQLVVEAIQRQAEKPDLGVGRLNSPLVRLYEIPRR